MSEKTLCPVCDSLMEPKEKDCEFKYNHEPYHAKAKIMVCPKCGYEKLGTCMVQFYLDDNPENGEETPKQTAENKALKLQNGKQTDAKEHSGSKKNDSAQNKDNAAENKAVSDNKTLNNDNPEQTGAKTEIRKKEKTAESSDGKNFQKETGFRTQPETDKKDNDSQQADNKEKRDNTDTAESDTAKKKAENAQQAEERKTEDGVKAENQTAKKEEKTPWWKAGRVGKESDKTAENGKDEKQTEQPARKTAEQTEGIQTENAQDDTDNTKNKISNTQKQNNRTENETKTGQTDANPQSVSQAKMSDKERIDDKSKKDDNKAADNPEAGLNKKDNAEAKAQDEQRNNIKEEKSASENAKQEKDGNNANLTENMKDKQPDVSESTAESVDKKSDEKPQIGNGENVKGVETDKEETPDKTLPETDVQVFDNKKEAPPFFASDDSEWTVSDEWIDWMLENKPWFKKAYGHMFSSRRRQLRYLNSREPSYKAITNNVMYDTEASEMFYSEIKNDGQEYSRTFYYKTYNGQFFSVTMREGKPDEFSIKETKDIKRLLMHEPDIYVRVIPDAVQNVDDLPEYDSPYGKETEKTVKKEEDSFRKKQEEKASMRIERDTKAQGGTKAPDKRNPVT